MKSRLSKSWIQVILSLLVGLILTVSLLLSVPLLSENQTFIEEEKPLLVVNLIHWKPVEKPIEKEITQPKKIVTPPKPEPKKKPKPIKKPPAKQIEKIALNPVEKVEPELEPTSKKPSEPIIEEKIEIKTAQKEELSPPTPIFQLSEMPQYLHKEIPIYPTSMRTLGKIATVTLEAYIDKKGKVKSVTILKSAGKAFDQAASAAIWASTFSPAKANGKAVAVLLRLPVRFKLR